MLCYVMSTRKPLRSFRQGNTDGTRRLFSLFMRECKMALRPITPTSTARQAVKISNAVSKVRTHKLNT
jgi:hypothetical protein